MVSPITYRHVVNPTDDELKRILQNTEDTFKDSKHMQQAVEHDPKKTKQFLEGKLHTAKADNGIFVAEIDGEIVGVGYVTAPGKTMLAGDDRKEANDKFIESLSPTGRDWFINVLHSEEMKPPQYTTDQFYCYHLSPSHAPDSPDIASGMLEEMVKVAKQAGGNLAVSTSSRANADGLYKTAGFYLVDELDYNYNDGTPSKRFLLVNDCK